MSTNYTTSTTYSFSGHETFPFRLGWLYKGVHAVTESPEIFNSDEAIVTLGVGKNMVRSIRHWCTTLGLIKEVSRGSYCPTELGNYIFGTDGTDPYLEDIGTLWLLHWRLCTNIEKATTWHFVFNHLNRPEFSKAGLANDLQNFVSSHGAKVPSEKTLQRDIDCLVKTYTAAGRSFSEEAIECPLIELNLLRDFDATVRLSRGEKTTLPDLIFVIALVDFYTFTNGNSKTMSAERIIHGEFSPGRVFVLDDNSVIQRLENLESLTGGQLVYDSTAGMRQVLFHTVPNVTSLIETYYRRS